MRALAIVGICALVLCASAAAKFRVTIAAGDSTPAVGQPVTVVVRSGQQLDYNLRLMAVAPGRNIFRVVATLTGDTGNPDPNIARNGFEVKLVRMAPDRWRGTVRLRTPGPAGAWWFPKRRAGRTSSFRPGIARLTLTVH